MKSRTYSELVQFSSFQERFDYLVVRSKIGLETFGVERHLNQRFYTSVEWRNLRNHIIARDLGNDLSLDGYPIHEKMIIHHMNPITVDDVVEGNEAIMDPEFLITTRLRTHNAIHFGRELPPGVLDLVTRKPGDTTLW